MAEAPITVMVVEDEEGLADAMVKYLKLKKFNAFYCLNGQDAVEKFQEHRPEICLLDIQLGYSEWNGLEVLEKIKQIDEKAECIILTRVTDEESIEKAKSLNAKHYLLKPLDTQDWLNVVLKVADEVNARRHADG